MGGGWVVEWTDELIASELRTGGSENIYIYIYIYIYSKLRNKCTPYAGCATVPSEAVVRLLIRGGATLLFSRGFRVGMEGGTFID